MEKFVQSALQNVLNLPEEEDLLDNDESCPSTLTSDSNNKSSSSASSGNHTFLQKHSIRASKLIGRAYFYSTMYKPLAVQKFRSPQSNKAFSTYSRIDSNICLGGIPTNETFAQHLLSQEHVVGVISLNEHFELSKFPIPWTKQFNVEFLQLPTVDMFVAPSQANLRKGIEFIERTLEQVINNSRSSGDINHSTESTNNNDDNDKEKVETKLINEPSIYIHCRAGRTRSATLVICYLIHKHRWTPKQALDFVKSKHPIILIGPRQKKAIEKYYEASLLPRITQPVLIP